MVELRPEPTSFSSPNSTLANGARYAVFEKTYWNPPLAITRLSVEPASSTKNAPASMVISRVRSRLPYPMRRAGSYAIVLLAIEITVLLPPLPTPRIELTPK